MSALQLLGVTSLLFVAAFTWRAAMAAHTVGQSPRSAIIEAWVNLCLGFSINFAANLLLLPMVGAAFTMGENFWLGCIYTAISIVRQYVIRRWFNERVHAVAQRLAGGVPDAGCRVPPDGWWCSRARGHPGPCAARRVR